jgi:hypothetical protein
MNKLLKRILTDKNSRNLAMVQALALIVMVAGDPWYP